MAGVLHVLSQRPSLTGSGITLDALVRHAAAAGWRQRVVVGVPVADPQPAVGGLAAESISPLRFGGDDLPFAVPGMSDVMPYPSTRFSSMGNAQIGRYKAAWRAHLLAVAAEDPPDLIHCHHLWIMSSMLRDLFPTTAIVNQCHATGFRQMRLCPNLAAEVQAGCARLDAFAVLHPGHKQQLCRTLAVPAERVHVVGAGYREELFHSRGRSPGDHPRLLYIGKLSPAKGLPQLLDAVELLAARIPGLRLHVAGSGGGEEARAIETRMASMDPLVVHHGHLDQPRLAELMRAADVCVLPSFYEGLPLVLVEALACGCRLVATELPGIRDQLAPHLGPALHLVALPEMRTIDQPRPEALAAFVRRLAAVIEEAAAAGPAGGTGVGQGTELRHFTWQAVFRRVERVWRALLDRH
jgi:glycosyltransferase involved in cell wall biosynthesis